MQRPVPRLPTEMPEVRSSDVSMTEVEDGPKDESHAVDPCADPKDEPQVTWRAKLRAHTSRKDMSEREATFWRAWIHIARWREKDTHALRDLIISFWLRADKFRQEQLCRPTIEG